MLLQTLFNTQCCQFVKLRETEDGAIAKVLDIGRNMLQKHSEYDTLMNDCKDGTLLLHFYELNLQRENMYKYKGIKISYDYGDDDSNTVTGIRICIRPPHPIYQNDAAGDELLCYIFEHKTANMLRYCNQKLVAKKNGR